ncbi:MAG: Fis family transcriptional regulator [Epsilonproteobacteria bacterium]|nr:Fis family transcriptional regulator [Campylobacterota bacterium]
MFVAKSPISQKIYKLALMLRQIDVDVYIYGPPGVGKSYLARFICPDAVIYNDKLNNSDAKVIIENYTNQPTNFRRVIAIGDKPLNQSLFPFNIELKPLSQRVEDVEAFMDYFAKEISKELRLPNIPIHQVDSTNLHTLKRSIYKQFLCYNNTKEEIVEILKDFFDKNYQPSDSYYSMLRLFDEALFEVFAQKYKSKLQIAQNLKLNRHTVTKKLKELEEG